ncbi:MULTISPECIES: ABC transporter permease [unclassified Enterococcus]|uniref:ABC transporter permease n=1 Tax=unclassified Enterococcus TaxID=2608891 RepID=UPI0015571E16|nr:MULTISPECIES: ABC transporter permease [unclassified Enterococcus]MBS7576720.1 ABC transporter permease [Enterococcus sp. MMGLQ5-2]MBS7583793.1 ABC transporter permease [Enterococcus sp. MMGLQ5-1]NPD11654.1 ABC transporter permease [Enterococcus sp. MMGLQ5-1]NPD36557.1 ABC transporter permease [Enterococcus sp. MMGLQ5-2]
MTKQKLYLKMISAAILKRKSRMLIAILSIIIGATVVSGLSAIYLDMPRQLNQEFRRYGANLIFLSADSERGLSEQDYEQIKASLEETAVTGLSAFRYQTIKLNENPLIFCSTDIMQVQKTHPYWYVEGDYPVQADEILVGKELAEQFRFKLGQSYSFIGEMTATQNITSRLKVVGILQTGGQEEAIAYGNSEIAKTLFPSQILEYDLIEASIPQNENQLNRIGKKILKTSDNHINYQLAKKLTSSEAKVSKKLTALIFFVTAIVLLITLICVGTTMMSVIQERRKEIGLKKALGADNQVIVGEFLGEACLLGCFGGVLGAVLGYFFARVVGLQVFGRLVDFSIWIIPLTILISLMITMLACFIPVKNALNVDPAIVLKGE